MEVDQDTINELRNDIRELEFSVAMLENDLSEADLSVQFVQYLTDKSDVLSSTAQMLLEGHQFELLKKLLLETNG